MMIPPDEEKEDGRSQCHFYGYVNERVVNTNIKIPEEVDHAIRIRSSHGWLAFISPAFTTSFFFGVPSWPLTHISFLPFIHYLP
jgi:hypothetical protein